jgi:haloalkane dehalogenase
LARKILVARRDANITLADHVMYLDAWFDELDLGPYLLVGHGWGATLAFLIARRRSDTVGAIAYCEPVVGAREWSDFPGSWRSYFQSLRGAEG